MVAMSLGLDLASSGFTYAASLDCLRLDSDTIEKCRDRHGDIRAWIVHIQPNRVLVGNR